MEGNEKENNKRDVNEYGFVHSNPYITLRPKSTP